MVEQQIGAFRIRRLIGYGGFADVYFEESCRQKLLNAIRFIVDYTPPFLQSATR